MTPQEEAIQNIINSTRLAEKLASQAKTDFQGSEKIIKNALSHNSGQSQKVQTILKSLWNGELCENLCGLDPEISQAVVFAIAARAHLAGDADELLRPLTFSIE